MVTQEPGTIERVDIRRIWANEATDFTPWLANNLDVLGKALGLDLEFQAREAPIGAYSLDILARDVQGGRPVAIENQLGPTDHNHLGQLLTYGAGCDAEVMVWIAKEFRDEHREALDLLNHRTGEDSEFFGVEVELWQIDGSRPAVNFKLVSTPNQWRKQIPGSRPPAPVSEKMQKYRAFFQELIDTLRQQHQFTNARKGQPQNWYSFAAGKTGFSYGANFVSNGRARVELYIDTGERVRNEQAFGWLSDQQAAVESELGLELSWEPLASRRACRIAAYRDGSIEDDEASLRLVGNWMIDELIKFKRVFGPMLGALPDDLESGSGESAPDPD